MNLWPYAYLFDTISSPVETFYMWVKKIARGECISFHYAYVGILLSVHGRVYDWRGRKRAKFNAPRKCSFICLLSFTRPYRLKKFAWDSWRIYPRARYEFITNWLLQEKFFSIDASGWLFCRPYAGGAATGYSNCCDWLANPLVDLLALIILHGRRPRDVSRLKNCKVQSSNS